MTRVNLVPPHTLTIKHLVAEYRELPRIFKLARAWGHYPSPLPPTFTLGKGHMRFFYNKCGWLIRRQQSLIDEMLFRGYDPSYRNVASLARALPTACFAADDWEPSPRDILISQQRIEERLNVNAPNHDQV